MKIKSAKISKINFFTPSDARGTKSGLFIRHMEVLAGTQIVPTAAQALALSQGRAGDDFRSPRIAACGMHAARELLHFSKQQFQHELELTLRTHSDRRGIQRRIDDAEVGSRNEAIWVSIHPPVENVERFGPELKL